MKNKIFILLLIGSPFFAVAQKDSSGYYLQQGNKEVQKEQWSKAFGYFQRAAELQPADAEAHLALARAATQLKKYDIAAAAFQKGLELKKRGSVSGAGYSTITVSATDFEDVFAYAARAGLLKTDGQTKYITGKTYAINVGKPDSLKNTAGADQAGTDQIRTSQAEAGEAGRNQSVKESLPEAEIAYRIGKIFLNKENYRAAAPFLEQAALLDSLRADRTYECALNFSAVPDPQQAIKYYLLAQKRGYPADAVFLTNLSKAYLASGQTATSEEIKQKLNTLNAAVKE